MLKNRVFGSLIALTLTAGASAWAKGQEITVAVNGMVCGFCAQGITKKFNAQEAVQETKVDLKDKLVKLRLKDGRELPDDVIKGVLTEAGYNVEKIDRN